MDTIPEGKYLKQISDLERKSWKAIITLKYITHEIMFLEEHGFQHGISAHGEMREFHLKTCEQETAIGAWEIWQLVWLSLHPQHHLIWSSDFAWEQE